MAKTWETLFHLSNFMKYLIKEVLPEEKVDAHQYVLDSLQELLQVTSECIDTIKLRCDGKRPKECYSVPKMPMRHHYAKVSPSLKTMKDGGNRNGNYEIDTYAFDPTNQSNHESILPFTRSGYQNPNLVKIVMNSKSIYFHRKFVSLSNDMHSGSALGYYCKPCEAVYYAEKDWVEHCNTDQKHIVCAKLNTRYICCHYCRLVVFAPSSIAEDHIAFHCIEHLQNKNRDRFSSITDINKEENSVKPAFETGRNQTPLLLYDSEVETMPNSDKSRKFPFMSKSFIDLDKNIHSTIQKGYYCIICDAGFFDDESWKCHFRHNSIHNNLNKSCQVMELCGICSFEVFGPPSEFTLHSIYHRRGHDYEKITYNTKEIITAPNINDNQNSTIAVKNKEKEINLNQLESSDKNFSKNGNDSITYISIKFQRLNSLTNVNNRFYCKPCDEAYTGVQEWNEHFEGGKHTKIFSNRNYKNLIGKCSVCDIVVVGLEKTIQAYMEYHRLSTEGHLQDSSHSLVAIESKNNLKITGEKLFNKGSEKKPSTFNLPEHAYENDNLRQLTGSIRDTDKKPASPTSKTNRYKEQTQKFTNIWNAGTDPLIKGPSGWRKPSNEEKIKDRFLSILNDRKGQGPDVTFNFVGLCLRCNIEINYFFDWEDHLSSAKHCQEADHGDYEHSFTAICLSLFGSNKMINSYKILAYDAV